MNLIPWTLEWVRHHEGVVLDVAVVAVPEELARRRTFIRTPGFDSPTECWSFLFSAGVPHHDGRVEQGPDGLWRGSGEVAGG